MRVFCATLVAIIANCAFAGVALRQQVQALCGKQALSPTSTLVTEVVSLIDADGRTPLHYSAMFGDLDLTRVFLGAGVDPMVQDNRQRYPFDYLVERAEDPRNPNASTYALIASYVLEKMPSRHDLGSGHRAGRGGIHQRDNKGWTPLVWAIVAKNKERVTELLDAGAEVIDQGIDSTSTRQYIFKIAEIAGDQEILDLLIERMEPAHAQKAFNESRSGAVGVRSSTLQKIADKIPPADRARIPSTLSSVELSQMSVADSFLVASLSVIDLHQAITQGNHEFVRLAVSHNVELAGSLILHLLVNNFGAITRNNREDIDGIVYGNNIPSKILQILDKEFNEESGSLLVNMAKVYRQSGRFGYKSIPFALVMLDKEFGKETKPLLTTIVRAYRLMHENGHSPDSPLALLAGVEGLEREWLELFNYLKETGEVDIYQELVKSLAVAKKTENDNLVRLAIQQSLLTGIDFGKLIDHAESLHSLNLPYLLLSKKHEVLATVHAIQNDDEQRIRILTNHLLNDKLETKEDKDKIIGAIANGGSVELLQFFVDHDILDDESGSKLIYRAAYHKNWPVLKMAFNLGFSFATDQSFRMAIIQSFWIKDIGEMKKIIKLFIDNGANINAVNGAYGNGESPLTTAINFLQVPQVEFLLAQGASSGNVGLAVSRQEEKAKYRELQNNLYNLSEGEKARNRGLQKNFAKIKQLLAERGLIAGR